MFSLSSIHVNPDNPRTIKDSRFEKLVNSIKDFPKMLSLRPIIVDNTGMIIGGNMRYKALIEAGYKEVPDEWVRRAIDLTDEERRRFIVEDNVEFGEFDFNLLEDDYTPVELDDWGLDIIHGDVNAINTVNDLTDQEWAGVPDLELAPEQFQLVITFDSKETRDAFEGQYGIRIRRKGNGTWKTVLPWKDNEVSLDKSFEPDEDEAGDDSEE